MRGTLCRLLGATALASLAFVAPALAQGGLADALAQRAGGDPNAEMIVRANEMIYNNDANTVTAIGNVQIYYNGRTVQADRVTYDRTTNRVKASGNIKIVETDGTVSYAESLDLTDDFGDGFVNSLRIDAPQKNPDGTIDYVHFAARRAERTGGNITVLEKGVYTACEPCKEKPEKPPLWQVKAARIIHNNQEKMIYFEDAHLEFWGIPIAYVPFFSTPDPTVKRKSGFLAPTFLNSTELGFGLETPYFIALAPNYDLTVTPGFTSRQGPMLDVEWRHRTVTGSYKIRAAGVYQMEPEAFPIDQGNRDTRGLITTSGEFNINEYWKWGWNGTLLSDRYFIEDYDLRGFKKWEAISTLYLTGQGEKSWFDARLYHFLGLTVDDVQKQLPVVHPVIDYDYIVDRPVFGGELGWNVNVTSLTRQQADFDQILAGFACDGANFMTTNPSACLQRGIDGTYSRISANLYWKRTLTDLIGQQWTPFFYLRGDLAWTHLDSSTPVQFIDAGDEFSARGLPAIGLEYRYPFIAANSLGTHVLEPIAQIILRPQLSEIGRLPNEDAQSLIFDDTTLFAWDKFSGYDRIEDGSRINAGLQYTLTTPYGGSYNVLFGQSYALWSNPYTDPDMSNTGLQSGLDTDVSDYVARLYAQPFTNLSFSSRMRFDQDDWSLRRLELDAAGTVGPVTASLTYGYYHAQPLLGLETREGIQGRTSVKFADYWTVSGGAVYNFSEDRFVSTFAGLSYLDDCFGMGVNFSRTYTDSSNKDPVTKVMFQLSLRTLGSVGLSQKLQTGENVQ